mmetsp:Transcript_134828/g.341041  ORF Transcript_134828/g.341041 Transcript_134828/m.341041 type:complete len:233 (+) Transcript_134828:164-862(+)
MASELLGCGDSSESDGDAEASEAPEIPLDQFPPLPRRGPGFWSEPMLGLCIVGVLCAMLVAVTQGMAAGSEAASTSTSEEGSSLRKATVTLIWVEAITAALCTAYLLVGNAGVISRSRSTCYPMPAEVEERLRENRTLSDMKNPPGPQGSRTLGSYCVRCLVWRPPKEDDKAHHCNVCQRCVRGFDHHCGVFGRCIVRGNMPCFITLIAMMFAGMATAMVAATASVGAEAAV